jgi:hypothetical protein
MSDPEASPGSPEQVVIRPLSKGIRRDKGSRQIPSGGFYDLRGLISTNEGLRKRYAFDPYCASSALAKGPLAEGDQIIAVEAVEDPVTGSQVLFAIGRDWIYLVASGAGTLTECYRTHTTGTVTISAGGTAIEGASSPAWLTNHIKTGDVIKVIGNTTPAQDEIRTIGGVTDEDSMASTVAFTYAHTAKTYTIYRKNGTGGLWVPVVARAPGRLIVASRGNELWNVVVAGTVSALASASPATGAFTASAVAVWRDRTWAVCDVDGSDGTRPQRYRWSLNTDLTDFSGDYAWAEISEEGGPILRFFSLGNLMAVFFPNAVYVGEPSSVAYLPMQRAKVQTAGVGLAGQLAVCSYKNEGIFFQGQDNFYVIGSNGIEEIGTPVVRSALRSCQMPSRCQMLAVPKEQQIWCGLTRSGEAMEDIWVFDIPSKSWSSFGRTAYALSAPWFSDTLSWDDWTTETWDDEDETTGPTWDSETAAPAELMTSLVNTSGAIYKYARGTGTADPDGTEIGAMFETGDLDFDAPGKVKFVNRLAVTISEDELAARTIPIVFSVSLSRDGGKTWKVFGSLSIAVGETKGYVNRRVTGTIFRFRVSSTSLVGTYVIEEIQLDVKGAGKELATRWQRGEE